MKLRRWSRLCLLPLGIAAAGSAGAPRHLEALTPTSGQNAAALLDRDPTTTWQPTGDARGEGVLLRMVEAQPLEAVELTPCPGAAVPALSVFIDGTWSRDVAGGGSTPAVASLREEGSEAPMSAVRSVFLRLDMHPACLADVRLLGPGNQDLGVLAPRRAPGTVVASSTLSPADAYHPAFLFDQRTDFGWVEGAKGTGAGQSITLTLESPAALTGLEVWNGYQRSKDHFTKNARISRLRVEVPGQAPFVLPVKDAMGAQVVPFPQPVTTQTLKLVVEGAQAGTRFPDLVVSELRLRDTNGSFGIETPDLAQRQAALVAEITGRPLGSLVDTRLSRVCTVSSDGAVWSDSTFKLRSNHSFALYDQTASDLDNSTVTEVFDGAWVVVKQAKVWSEIQLYGRRHVIASRWQPYTGTSEESTTRVSGGILKVARVADLGADGLATLLATWAKAGVGPGVTDCEALADFARDKATLFPALTARGAVVVEGKALTQVFWGD